MAFYHLENNQMFTMDIEGVSVNVSVQVLDSTTKQLTCTGHNGVDVQFRLKQTTSGILSVMGDCNFTYMSRVVFAELSRYFQASVWLARENWHSILKRFIEGADIVLFTDSKFGFVFTRNTRSLVRSLRLLRKYGGSQCDFIVQSRHPAAMSSHPAVHPSASCSVLCSVSNPKIQKAVETVAACFQQLLYIQS